MTMQSGHSKRRRGMQGSGVTPSSRTFVDSFCWLTWPPVRKKSDGKMAAKVVAVVVAGKQSRLKLDGRWYNVWADAAARQQPASSSACSARVGAMAIEVLPLQGRDR